MKNIAYRIFSLQTHTKNRRKGNINLCQFELTFGCQLHCQHCYSDCYNRKKFIAKELTTGEVKFILDKVYRAGALWLSLTGGDPLTRKDFLELYSYCKRKGFIVILFTNGYSLTKEIVRYLKKAPPFVIEITLNALTQGVYEEISQIRGSFAQVMEGIELIVKAGLALKLKVQVTKQNWEELPRIKKFIEGLGLEFSPNPFLNARLNKDPTPCKLRISAEQAYSLKRNQRVLAEECFLREKSFSKQTSARLFPCLIVESDSIYIDPYGNLVPCICIRGPGINLLKYDLAGARRAILEWLKARQFSPEAKCATCTKRYLCLNCPGKAYLEQKDLSGISEWFCQLAHYPSNPGG